MAVKGPVTLSVRQLHQGEEEVVDPPNCLGKHIEVRYSTMRGTEGAFAVGPRGEHRWLAPGQVVKVIPDQHLLDQVSVLHKQALTQIKWLRTLTKETGRKPAVLQRCRGKSWRRAHVSMGSRSRPRWRGAAVWMPPASETAAM
jgi:hypothetical protein